MSRWILALTLWGAAVGVGCFDGDEAPTPVTISMTEANTGETLPPTQPDSTLPETDGPSATESTASTSPTESPTGVVTPSASATPEETPAITPDNTPPPGETSIPTSEDTQDPGTTPTPAPVEPTAPVDPTDPLATVPPEISPTVAPTATITPVPPTPLPPVDADEDGYTTGTDCNDSNAAVNPGVGEVCDGVDNNCSGGVDEGVTTSLWMDGDDDGYGVGNPTPVCPGASGYAGQGGDCNDSDATIHPDAAEVCDNLDNNCNGQADEGAKEALYVDYDGDGYGAGASVLVCGDSSGYVAVSGDCDDNNPAIKPGATEVCNGVDDDCDSFVDEGVKQNLYLDNDSDGYGTGSPVGVCVGTAGYATQAGDCNDNDPAIRPGATELCNNKDDDCDGQTDEGLKQSAYADNDGDGYGAGASSLQCVGSVGYSTQAGDCNDSDAAVKPGATEVCNGRDDNCDGQVDEGVLTTWYADTDGDGYGVTTSPKQACALPSGYSATSGDCNDLNPSVNPGATEILGNGIDENCDGFDGGATDFNDDGYPDLVVVNSRSNSSYKVKSTIYFGGAAGLNTNNKAEYDTSDARGSCAADFDLDGFLDVAFANYSSDGANRATTSTVYYGSVTGPVPTDKSSFPTEGAVGCVAADFDADGDVDLLFIQQQNAAGSYTHGAWLYPNNSGTLATSSPVQLPTLGASSAVASDIDDDGFVDVVISNYRSESSYKVDSYIYWGAKTGLSASNRSSLPTQGASSPALLYDVNDDGEMDVVMANTYDGSSYSINSPIYFGPTWGPTAVLNLPTIGAVKPVAGDLNGDGWVDITYPGSYDGDCAVTTYVYYGNSADTWSTSSRTSLNMGCMSDATITDTEGDGYDDLIVSSRASTSNYTAPARYFPGGADGVRIDRVAYLSNTGVVDLDVGDMDGDGYDDVAFSSYQDGGSDYQATGYVYWGSQRGIPNSRRTDLSATGVYFPLVEDLNNDGWIDVLLVQRWDAGYNETNTSRIYWGSSYGPRTWSSSTISTRSARWACSGDFNKDGYRDVVIANYEDGGNTDTPSFLYYGTATGPSTSKTNLNTKGATFCLVDDLDGDGDEDITFADYESNDNVTTDSYVFWNDNGTFSSSSSARTKLTTVGGAAVAAYDFTGDGRKDLIFSNNYSSYAYLYKSTSSGFDTTPIQLRADSAFRPALFADFDKDGRMDILLQSFFDGDNTTTSYVYYGDTNLSFTRKASFSLGLTTDAAVADINGDGWTDITFATYYDGDYNTNAWVYWGSSAGFSSSNRQSLPTSGTASMKLTDLNKDNKLDLVFVTYEDTDYSTESYVYYNNGSTFNTTATQLPGYLSSEVQVADLDKDGWPDIIAPHMSDNQDGDVPTYVFWGSSRGYFRTNYTSFATNGNTEVHFTR